MRSLRLLEVGAMPFPTVQGTQALLREQCEALARRGHEVHLLVYAHGGFEYQPPGYVIHRLADWPRERSERSGPSWSKAALDLSLAWEIRRLSRRLQPDLVHAHNYEALVAALIARPGPPLVYHAHTLFVYELPTFAQGNIPRRAAGLVGEAMDRRIPPLADYTLAVSPRLVDELLRCGHPPERLECSLPGIDLPVIEGEPAEQRRLLGLEGAEVIGYGGNLDGYQGLPLLVEATRRLAMTRPKLRLLVVTASDTKPLVAALADAGVADRLVVLPHGSFAQALARLSVAQVCLVPRTAPGGIPIKLLAYLAAGRPVVCSRAGTAGMDLGPAVTVVPDDDPESLALATGRLLDAPKEARRLGHEGHRMVRERFAWERRALDLEGQLERIIEAEKKVRYRRFF
jgi:glycosyltransferase involved in cell wall biosynthesis